jgi:hypothetical protein
MHKPLKGRTWTKFRRTLGLKKTKLVHGENYRSATIARTSPSAAVVMVSR